MCWERVREVEEDFKAPFGEVVHDLRLKYEPARVPVILGVARHFLYEHFGWAMDKVGYVERSNGMPLGRVVAMRRAEGARLADLAEEWGLAVTTLYNALRRRGDIGAIPPVG